MKKIFSLLVVFLISCASNGYAQLGVNSGDLIFNISGVQAAKMSQTIGLEVSGTVKLPSNALACSGATEGHFRYNTGDIEVCDGSSWQALAFDTGGSSDGYFVFSSGTYTGNLGGRSGADSICLTELTTNSWMGKASATLNASTVKAFLTGDELSASTTYYFANAGDVTSGGASFTTDASGLGPNDTFDWSDSTGLDSGLNKYRNSLDLGSSTKWAVGTLSDCSGYTSSGFSASNVGAPFSWGDDRWIDSSRTTTTCSATAYLICVVNP